MKTQILYAVVFTCRYLDLFTNFYSMYNTVLKVSAHLSQGAVNDDILHKITALCADPILGLHLLHHLPVLHGQGATLAPPARMFLRALCVYCVLLSTAMCCGVYCLLKNAAHTEHH